MFVALALGVPATAAPLFRISLENTREHVQVKAVERFARDLARAAAGLLEVEVYPEALLFRDRDVVTALAEGKIEMAVPGTWQLDRFEPAVGVFLLPPFYGRDREFVYRQLEGPLGNLVTTRLEAATGAVVVGRWIDLGAVHLFGVSTAIRRHEDIAGRRIRIAGGEVNALRLRVLGATSLVISWPELPEKLRGGAVDGVLTSYETVASAKLWEAGIRYAFEDAEYFGQYVPLVSGYFWQRASPEVRRLIRETWERHVDAARTDAARAQQDARSLVAARGVEIVTPTALETGRWRAHLARRQAEMIAALGLDAAIVSLIPPP
jgi:C4-dicarboxylate-binding protein DctP